MNMLRKEYWIMFQMSEDEARSKLQEYLTSNRTSFLNFCTSVIANLPLTTIQQINPNSFGLLDPSGKPFPAVKTVINDYMSATSGE